jgi:hypothetical protein
MFLIEGDIFYANTQKGKVMMVAPLAILISLIVLWLLLVRKVASIMRLKTRNLTLRIRETLLELPDRVFFKTLLDWITLSDAHFGYPDGSDAYRYSLGFRVQSLETQTIYATFNALHENEPHTVNAAWIEPGISTLRSIVKNFTLEQFYSKIILLASDALFECAMQEHWGPPPSSMNSGYDFLEHLYRHLEAKIYRRADQMRLPSSHEPPAIDDIPLANSNIATDGTNSGPSTTTEPLP